MDAQAATFEAVRRQVLEKLDQMDLEQMDVEAAAVTKANVALIVLRENGLTGSRARRLAKSLLEQALRELGAKDSED